MKKYKRFFASLMVFLLILSNMNLTVLAAGSDSEGDPEPDPFEGMINISSDWRGSVMGDNGGQSNINSDNFEITENGDGTVTLKSINNRGKIAGSSEGIAYYFEDVPADANYKLSATAHVDSWTANNQVSFGLMLRGNILENQNQGTFTGDYVAVGALDQVMKGFYKYEESGIQKNDHVFESAAVPTADQQYDLTIEKSGNLYIISVNGEEMIIEDYNGEINYAGLFTSRNTVVTFSNINFEMEGQVDLGDWEFSAFGDNTRTSDRNQDPTVTENGVRIVATGGKISSSVDGISFYHKKVPADANFEITTRATVNSINGGDNQVSFGLMLRDEIGEHGTSGGHEANYVALGALDLNNQSIAGVKGFYKVGSEQIKLDPFSQLRVPGENEVYDLSIRKSGDTYVVTANGIESDPLTLDNLFTDNIFAGLYVARGADVTFSNFDIKVDARVVEELVVDASDMNTEILMGQNLDLTGLKVTAKFSDGSEQALSQSDYIVTGFNSSEVGTNTITINYNGKTAQVNLDIMGLTVTDLEIRYFPAKTDYFKGDVFDPQGFSVIAHYNNGQSMQLNAEQYTFSINSIGLTEGNQFVFEDAGTTEVIVQSTETPEITTTFNVYVKDTEIEGLEIKRLPVKQLYFIGDELDLAGLSLYAKYGNGDSVRLTADEYTVSSLDTSTPGEREVTLTHKGKTATLSFEVKVKELVAIEVTNYPQTTYVVGEELALTELEISRVYDNEDRAVLAKDAYTVETSSFDNENAGTYAMEVVPNDTSINPISFSVTVREAVEVEWKSMRFGQSTSDARNYVNEKGGTVEIVALEGGGKITGDHDGISFYYTELDASEDNFVLSADIKVVEYAKTPHDGQESFGIMARDAVNDVQDASVFASNIAAIGGFSGGTREANGTQLFARTGVVAADGEGSQGVQRIMLNNERPAANNTYPETEYRLTLAKTNSGFVGQLNDGQETTIFEPEILNVQDGKMYVGFYTARLATIEVNNIEFTVTAAATDAPRVEPPAEPVTPNFEYLSLSRTPLTNYDLLIRPNVNGVVTVKQGLEVIARDVEVIAGEILEVPATLTGNSTTNFSTTFLPDDTQFLTSYNQIVHNVTVSNKTFAEGGDIYVSPTGTPNGDGTRENPLNLDTAIDYVKPGQHIFVMEGNYVRNSNIEIKKFNDGTEDAMKHLFADPDATTRPVIDFDRRSEGVVHSGSYWHVKGLDFARSAGNTKGYTIGGSHNIIENVSLYEHGDTGLQISRTDTTENNRDNWPSYNLILNNISFDNRDPSENNADGFAAKLTVGNGNVFEGNVSHNNIDDGWDLYTKVGTGPIGVVTLRNNIAFGNGTLTNGYEGNAGKNGFKLGGEGVHVPHIIENNLAFDNGYFGITSNSNPGLVTRNNIGFNNVGANLSLTTYAHIPTDFTIDGFVSLRTDAVPKANDNYPSHLNADNNYMFRSGQTANLAGEEPSEEIFESMQQIFNFNDQGEIVSVKRNADGEIQWGDLWAVYNEFMGIEVQAEVEVDEDQPETGSVSNEKIEKLAPQGKLAVNAANVSRVSFTSEQVDILVEKGTTVEIDRSSVKVSIPAIHFNSGKGITIDVTEQEQTNVIVPAYKQVRSKIYKFTISDGENVISEFGENPVVLAFQVDSDNVTDVNNLRVAKLNEATDEWEVREGGDYSNGVFTYSTNSFSIYTVLEVENVDPGTGDENVDPGTGDENVDPGTGDENVDPGTGDENVDPGTGDENVDPGTGDENVDPGTGDENVDPGTGDENVDPGTGDENVDPGTGDENVDPGTKVSEEASNDVNEDNTASDESSKEETKEDELPNTFSGLYNFLLIGLALITLGLALFFVKGRREKNLV
ncbi:DUF4573 domain-containing protein [Evansella sp. AB-P1]|uniref:bacterial Ig-like domain-containing protein n=1 Tax=Evansella sp. AB-P1 TaxID=3037653 RepID=UPI00241D33B4|nr:DUF4573 domain-containing protein [Evansella sp. AB-P1]MDG5786219.1 DUF4573 domain-containing protein [Evansella sp. AB-P1]